MRLLMVSGDRQAVVGEGGPFHALQRTFSRHFERIDVLCPRPDGPLRERQLFGRVHLHPAPCGRARMASWIVERGRELLAEHGHALIVSHDYGWFYNGFGAALLSEASGVPYVSELHHVPGHPVAASNHERLERAVARAYVGWARDRARAFRVVNNELPRLLRRWGVPAERILVLPSLYVDLEVFSPPQRAVEPRWDVTFVGRLVENKGLDRIVAALALAARDGRSWRALFVGRGPLRPALRADLARHGLEERAELLDWVQGPEELARIYRASRAVVCASTCEGNPRFTVEAMACGTPVVSTPVGMMGELLADGRAGLLCGFDADSLGRELARLLDDEGARRGMGERARAVAQPFEHGAMIAGYAAGLRRIAGAEAP